MGNREKRVEVLVNWTRWTFGIAWDYYKTKDYLVPECNDLWRLEISAQIPVIALSLLFGSKQLQ